MRIEHTHRGTTTAQTGFEVQAAHQDRSASIIVPYREHPQHKAQPYVASEDPEGGLRIYCQLSRNQEYIMAVVKSQITVPEQGEMGLHYLG